MENELKEFTVEYQDINGVIFYRNVLATDADEARVIICQMQPNPIIRAVTFNPDYQITNRQAEKE